MPKVTARTPLALIAAYGDNVETLEDKFFNFQSVVAQAPSLRSAAEWLDLLGLDRTLPAPDVNVPVTTPPLYVSRIAKIMETANHYRLKDGLPAIFTEREVKDTYLAAGQPPHVRRDMLPLLEAHASNPGNLLDLLLAAESAAWSGADINVRELRLMVGLDDSAPPAVPDETEPRCPERCPRSSLAQQMWSINRGSEKKVFSNTEIVATLEWEHSP